MNTDFLDSRTMQLWLLMTAIAFLTAVLAGVAFIVFGVEIPYVREFFGFLGIGGTAGTARNMYSDGPGRRAPYQQNYSQLPPGQPPVPPPRGNSGP